MAIGLKNKFTGEWTFHQLDTDPPLSLMLRQESFIQEGDRYVYLEEVIFATEKWAKEHAAKQSEDQPSEDQQMTENDEQHGQQQDDTGPGNALDDDDATMTEGDSGLHCPSPSGASLQMSSMFLGTIYINSSIFYSIRIFACLCLFII